MHERSRAFTFFAAAASGAAMTAAALAACEGLPPTSAQPPASPSAQRCRQSAMTPLEARAQTIAPGLRLRAPALPASARRAIVAGVLGVRLASGDRSLLERAAEQVRGTILAGLDEHGAATIALRRGADLDAAARSLEAMPGVTAAGPIGLRYAQSPQVIPNDVDFGTLPYDVTDPSASNPRIQWDMYVTDLPAAWAQPTLFGSPAVRIAIIDTGYDLSNPDLDGRVGASAVFDRGDGTIDPTASVQDGDGHGTDTSGIAAADTDNATDAAGTAGGATLLEARVFPTPSARDTNPPADTRDVAAAIDWALQHGANVINMSLGSGSADPTYEEPAVARAIDAGVTVVASAGNGSAAGIGQPVLDYPAADPGVIAVGASALCDGASARDYATSYEYVASYSNYTLDAAKQFVVAPGGDPSAQQIGCPTSACVDYLQWILNLYSTTAYGGGSQNVLIAGTSMAAPHVAGIAALMLSKDPSLTPSEIATILATTAADIHDAREGHGRVDANAALAAVP